MPVPIDNGDRMVLDISVTNPTMDTPQSRRSSIGNASVSPRSDTTTGEEVEASSNLLSDLVWIEQKMAQSSHSSASTVSINHHES